MDDDNDKDGDNDGDDDDGGQHKHLWNVLLAGSVPIARSQAEKKQAIEAADKPSKGKTIKKTRVGKKHLVSPGNTDICSQKHKHVKQAKNRN